MATTRWVGKAAATYHVVTVAVGGTIEAGDLFALTMNGKTLSVAAPSTSGSATATAIVTAWNALSSSLYPEFAQVTASANSADVVLTNDAAGIPFEITAATTESNGGAADSQTFVATTTTTATGPYHWDNAANWSGGAVPVNGDVVYIEGTSTSIRYGLAQSAVTLAALYIEADFTGSIGLPETNTSSSAAYPEYRARELAIGATILRVGGGEGQGSPLIRLNTGSVQTALTVQRTGSSSETGVPSLLWKGTNASNTVTVTRGAVGIAYRGTDAATVATLSVGFESGEQTDANVDVGAGTTLTTLAMQGGTVKVGCASTTITKNNGTLTVLGTGACTTLRNWKGTCNYRSSGTVTNLFCGAASLDFRADMRAKTITNADIYAGASILDPQAVVTWTNGVDLNGCGMDEVTLNLGKNIRLTPAGL
jgi:hypothetical protein